MLMLMLYSNQLPLPNAAYGPSKAMLHWFTVRINGEDAWLNAFVLNPGWVQTDLGNAGARHFGLQEAETTVEESCDGMVEVLGQVTKERHGGKMVSWRGEVGESW